MAGPSPDPYDFDDLLSAWQSASADFIHLVGPLSQSEWDTPTALPGWTVGDIVAHVGWLEGLLLDRIDPPHTPDWASLPHAASDFGRITEIPVDLRRSRSREEVLDELAANVAERQAVLTAGSHDVTAQAQGPFGPAPLGRVLGMRTLDTWIHEQDIRDALARPGHLDAPGAQVTAAQLLPGYGKVWAKLCGARPGEILRIQVTEPGIEFSRDVVVGDDGRATVIDGQAAPATVTLTMDWPTFLALSCGRGDVDAQRQHVTVEGDHARAESVLDHFCVMI